MRSSECEVGVGHTCRALTLARSTCVPFWLIVCPKNRMQVCNHSYLLDLAYHTIANGSLCFFLGRDKSKANFFFCFVFSSVSPLFTSLSPILLRSLRFYLVTSRKFGVSQRDSSIFFNPNGTGHNDPLHGKHVSNEITPYV